MVVLDLERYKPVQQMQTFETGTSKLDSNALASFLGRLQPHPLTLITLTPTPHPPPHPLSQDLELRAGYIMVKGSTERKALLQVGRR